MNPWDIYLANVSFEELPKSKIRPVVIIVDSAVVIDCIKMTGQPPRKGEYVLQKWREAGLHKPTTVRISKRLALRPNMLIKCIGTLHPIDIVEIQKLITK